MSLREQVRNAVDSGDIETLESIVSKEPKALRHLMGLMYDLNEERRKVGIAGIAAAARYHPKLAKKVITHLVYAMGKDAGAYVPTAPEVLRAIAEENPELLVPVASDLIRLVSDISLNEGVCDILRAVSRRCPGAVGRDLSAALKRRYIEGEHCGDNTPR